MTFTTFADLEAADETPLFFVEPRGDKPADPTTWPEAWRQTEFVSYLRRKYPSVVVSSFANEGKRGQRMAAKMKGMGLLAGMPDTVVIWDGGMAFLEWKGWDARGQAGKLSQQQVETCNRIHRNGHPVGCFYRGKVAIDWLRGLGAPLS